MQSGLTNSHLAVSRCVLLTLAALFCSSIPASAAITLDAVSASSATQTAVEGSTSLTWSHTLGSGSNRAVVCGVAIANTDTAIAPFAPTMTFNGIAMTAVTIPASPTTTLVPTHTETSTSKIETGMFYINDTSIGSLAAGSYTVVVTLPQTSTGPIAADCTSFFGMNQAAPEAVGSVYNGSSGAMTASLTTVTAGDWIIDSFGGGFGSSGTASPNTGQTQLYNIQLEGKSAANANAGILAGSSYELITTPGAVTPGWADTVSRYAYEAAAFAPATVPSYTVTAAASPSIGGTIALSPNQSSYPSGTSVQVTATPATNYSFTGFSGALSGTTNPQSFSVTSNSSVTANFAVNTCTLTINVTGSGTVTPASGSTYPCGTSVSVTATANSGWTFSQFTGGLTGGTNPQNITLNGNQTVTATFIQGTVCTLSTSVTGSGSITVNPTGTNFSCGTQLTITGVPSASQYSFTGFSGALTGTTNPQMLTLNSNSSVGATFTQTSFPINVTTVGSGTVTANPSASYYATGTQVTLTATPNTGSYFVGFTGGATGGSPATVTVNSSVNVTATFATPVITKDAVSHAASSGSASTLSWSHTLGAGSSRGLIIAVGETDSVASPDQYAVVSSVTYNGIYATPLPNSVVYGGTSGMVQTQLFYLLDSELPAAGTYTIQVTLAGSIAGISAGAVSLFGVNQGPPEVVTTNKNTSGADLITSSITTLTNNAWIVDVVEDGDVATLSADSGQTIAWQAEATSGTGGSSTEAVATAGATSIGWTGTANRLAESILDFAPATATVPPTYTLTTSTGTGSGTISSNPNLSVYPSGAGVLLTANAQTGYVFSSWSGDYTSTTNPLPITMTVNHSVTANFSSVATCTVTINIVGSGTLNVASGTAYNCGTSIQLVATAGSGYNFTDYSGDFSSTDNPAFFTITANSTITAEFDPIPQCTLTMLTSGSGTVSPSGTTSYACGSVVPITATPADSTWVFNGWSGDYTSLNNPGSVVLNQNDTVTATFVQGSSCTLTTSVVGSGTISPSSGTYLCGTTISLSAVAASKYLFNGWTGALASAGTTTPTSLTMSTNETVGANFAVNTAGVTGDTRTVTEPSYPPVCTVLVADQIVTSPVETNPDTTRVQAAINACPSGEAVEFSSSGSYNAFIIAPITLNAGVTMLVDPEVTILGSIKYADYGCVSSESWCNPLIQIAPNTYPSPGSAIMGDGIIDGRGGTTLTDKGESWWATGSDTRPRLIYLSSHTTGAGSDNFTAYKITLQNSPKFHISGYGNDWTVWGIKIKAPPDSPNTDGVDPSGSSNVTVTKSYISDGDDWVSPKADSGHIANVTVDYNYFYSGHGVSIGSETNAGLNNMFVHDDVIDNGFGGSSVDSLRIKSGASEGGEVYDVLYKNICINHGGDTIVIDPYYTSDPGTLYPNFHDITFSNITELIRDSAHKPTMTGYNTNGVVYPLTVTLDNFNFDGAVANDFKAPDNFNNVQFTFGPGPVNVASILEADAAVSTNYITVSNAVTNSNTAFPCTGVFVYLAGDLTAKTATVTAGNSATLTAVLQNLVSPLVAGTISYPQQNAPTGSISILEGTNVVGTGTISGRLTYISVPNVTAGTHTYTASYSGDSNYAAMSFGSYTVTANYPAPVAASQSVSVSFNTATPITLGATGSGTLTYTVVASPTHGALTGTAPALTYTPTTGYTGADTFTFKANNGTDSNVATISITVLSSGSSTAQSITFAAPSSPVTYGASSITLGATASSGLAVSYIVSGPASLVGNALSFTGVGTVSITASQPGGSGYAAATSVQRTVLVNAATLNVSVVGSPTRAFGTANPAFTYTLASFVNGDTQASATTGAPVLTTAATQNSAAAIYPINVSAGTLAAANYTFTTTNGTLTVTGNAAQKIVFPALYGYANGASVALVAQATSGLAVTYAVASGPATVSGSTLTVTGVGTITVTASQAGNSNFAAATPVSQSFTSH